MDQHPQVVADAGAGLHLHVNEWKISLKQWRIKRLLAQRRQIDTQKGTGPLRREIKELFGSAVYLLHDSSLSGEKLTVSGTCSIDAHYHQQPSPPHILAVPPPPATASSIFNSPFLYFSTSWRSCYC